jgi:hypothetical protein
MAKSDRREQTEELSMRDQMNEGTSMSRAHAPAEDDVARRAYALYEARGGEHGHDLDDWLTAETDVRQQRSR